MTDPKPGTHRTVLFDVDGTLLDDLANLRAVWHGWAVKYELDGGFVYEVAARLSPMETFAVVAPNHDPAACLAVLHAIEDADARSGDYVAFDGAAELLTSLPPGSWGLVTGNYLHRVGIRFERTLLPLPEVVVDAGRVSVGKPAPEGYLRAVDLLASSPSRCLAVEDGVSGVRAARAAGLEVWTVNTQADTAAAREADLSFATLADAAPEILAWVSGAASHAR